MSNDPLARAAPTRLAGEGRADRGSPALGVVVIGRNEGERLRRCLDSLRSVRHLVYVDSGSSDDSCALARSFGVAVVELAAPPGFSAARARNAGVARLLQDAPDLAYVQFVDGDCTIAPGWLDSAVAALEAQPDTAIVFGRRRELAPGANAYHRACDREWAVPAGVVSSCGGDALARVAALRSVGLFNAALIAGEEPDLCFRLRRAGWVIRCTGREMTTHDIAIASLGPWWRRARRAGFATMRLVHLHGLSAEPSWRRYLFSTVLWPGLTGVGLLGLALSGQSRGAGLIGLGALACVATQWLRLARREPDAARHPLRALTDSGLVMVVKFASLAGVAEFALRQVLRRRDTLIEYKGAAAS